MLPSTHFSRPGLLQKLANSSDSFGHKAEIAGLGMLAAPSAVALATHHAPTGSLRAGFSKLPGVRHMMSETGKHVTELGGLGVLAAPSAMALRREKKASIGPDILYYFFDELKSPAQE